MKGSSLFIFIVLLPAIIAFGHDIYLFTQDQNIGAVGDIQAAFTENDKGPLTFLASAGWIWTNYSPESYKTLAQGMEPEQWSTVNYILKQKAVFLGLFFAGFMIVLAFLLGLAKIGPFASERSKSIESGRRTEDALGRKKKAPMKYKRK